MISPLCLPLRVSIVGSLALLALGCGGDDAAAPVGGTSTDGGGITPGVPCSVVPTTYHRDADEDGYGDPLTTADAHCAPEGYVGDGTDCDDTVAEQNPGQPEVCGDGLDNDCNPATSDLCAAEACDGASYYVAPSGTDNGTCDEQNPCLTIDHASALLAPGDTLYARGGTYQGQESYWDQGAVPPKHNIWNAGGNETWGEWVCLRAYPGEEPVFDGEGTARNLFVFFEDTTSYVLIDGITIENYYVGMYFLHHVEPFDASHDIIFENGTIRDTYGEHGVYMAGYSEGGSCNPVCGRPPEAITFRNNRFLRNKISAIQFNHGPVSARDIKIYNNFFNNSERSVLHVSSVEGIDIFNNTFVYHDAVGGVACVDIMYGDQPMGAGGAAWSRSVAIKNNIFYLADANRSSLYVAISVEARNQPELTIDHNLYYSPVTTDCSALQVICWDDTTYEGCTDHLTLAELQSRSGQAANSVCGDPLLVDPLAGSSPGGDPDYHLQSGSAAINAGATIAEVVEDFEHEARPKESAYDIGADEF